MFERHLAWLVETCEVIPFRRLLSAAAEERKRPAVAITFDDGYADNHEYALPLLKQYNAPATIFVTAGFVAGDRQVYSRFCELRETSGAELRALSWEQARELRAEGIEIGAHTYGHPNLARLDREQARRELEVPKEMLEDRLGTQVDLFAYPFGKPRRHFDDTTLRLVDGAGYRHAAAVVSRAVRASDSPLAVPRFFATGDSVEDLAAKIRGDLDYLAVWQEHAPLALAKVVSPGDFRF